MRCPVKGIASSLGDSLLTMTTGRISPVYLLDAVPIVCELMRPKFVLSKPGRHNRVSLLSISAAIAKAFLGEHLFLCGAGKKEGIYVEQT